MTSIGGIVHTRFLGISALQANTYVHFRLGNKFIGCALEKRPTIMYLALNDLLQIVTQKLNSYFTIRS